MQRGRLSWGVNGVWQACVVSVPARRAFSSGRSLRSDEPLVSSRAVTVRGLAMVKRWACEEGGGTDTVPNGIHHWQKKTRKRERKRAMEIPAVSDRCLGVWMGAILRA